MIYTLTLNPAVDRELTVPAVTFDSVLRASEARVDCGGKGFNVSRMLKNLGTASTALGFLGGRSGELLQDGLRSLGIGTDFVWISDETRTNVSIVTEAHDRYIKVNEKGPRVPPAKQEELLAKIDMLTKPEDWWVLAGSLPPGVEDDFYARILQVLNRRRSRVILDTTGASLRLGCCEKPYLIKPNREEAAALTGLKLESTARTVEAANTIRDLGVQHVVISLGVEGALLCREDGAWLVRSPQIAEKNPIGAGDSLVGGLVWGLSRGFGLNEALGWGVACGAASASLSGTEVGSLALVKALLDEVKFEAL